MILRCITMPVYRFNLIWSPATRLVNRDRSDKGGSCRSTPCFQLYNKELAIVNVCNSPEHTSFKSRMRPNNISSNVPTLDTLLKFSMKSLEQSSLIYLVGDFNARTALSNFDYKSDDPELDNARTSHPCNTTRCS